MEKDECKHGRCIWTCSKCKAENDARSVDYYSRKVASLESALAAEKKRREEAETGLETLLGMLHENGINPESGIHQITEERDTLRAENERMREALEFYARDGWTGPCAYPFIPWIMEDKGAKARAALAKPEGAPK